MSKKNVLYLAQEIYPYLEDSQIGKEAELVPLGIMERGNDIRTFMPNYGTINERRNQLHEVIRLSGVNLTVNDKVHQLVVKVASLMPQRMQVYFIDNEDFFGRKGVFTDPTSGEFYDDNVERSVFFIRGVFETVKKLRWIPDIIHCQGWFSGLAPLYLKTLFKDDPALSKAKIVYSTYDTMPDYPFAENLTEVLAYDGIKDPLLDGKQLDKDALTELVLKYVDGIVVATADASKPLMDAIINSGVKYLDYKSNEQVIESMAEFYQQIYDGETKKGQNEN